MLVRRKILKECRDCKIIPGESVVAQYIIMVVNMKQAKCKMDQCSNKED